ncbi:MAG: 50S ribosomal protein L5 [Nanoarchaeota archaeon]|nr:50S ribosomal protein L5 [Nanoarchaeota archaeon]
MNELKQKIMNVMRTPKISKVVLSAGATGDNLEKSRKLLALISGMNPQIVKAGPRRRIPAFGVRPGLPLGTRVTLGGKKSIALLRKLLGAIDNTLRKNQINDNHFSFGIKEYIEIPGAEYVREIGIRGFNVTVVFERAGLRVKKKKIKSGHIPKKQHVSKEEIIKFMEEKFKTVFI